jgi:hypothetical protein
MIRLAAAVFREGRFQQSAPRATEIVEQKAMVADMSLRAETASPCRRRQGMRLAPNDP